MSATLIDGKAYAAALRNRLSAVVGTLKAAQGRAPALAVVLVGDDPASQVYVRNKARQTQEIGMRSIEHHLDEKTSQEDLQKLVQSLNADPAVDGILVQLPLPAHLDEAAIIEEIDPAKDVDGLTEASAGRLVLGKPGLRPCTPTGCVLLARDVLGDLSGKSCVIVGRSILVGKPAAFLFLEQNCTVTIAHSRTQDLPALCRDADILIAAVGRAQMIKGDWIKPGATVIDVGINRVDAPERGAGKTRLVGDVDFESASQTAGAITPVPGGVGPMTIACLLRNTVLAACARMNWPLPAEI
ncbi:MAG: bifunctional methylenetetrahydrofolate dehydrogenase/methenyltetrahydrofolate cyclohydrolase FolD [Robiginitomaculum sp.]|nr:bifunctional methylenetetrahydrofolate dehydrogenase/methenyltetrahydrofolate cyclohydrolase FolD [Robiginitomaculum sp.]MDQ7076769.1 bifunctional methylenetetrahydrofolate dehydrogenase/methenyltetrahydrofolate cyclohydrolase FolD [Robiginitomaculum sp.]